LCNGSADKMTSSKDNTKIEYLPGPLKIVKQSRLDDDQRLVEQKVAAEVQKDLENYIRLYDEMRESLGGWYICSDLVKELFEPYSESKDSRTKYSYAVHHTSSVVSAEILCRRLGSVENVLAQLRQNKKGQASQISLVTGPPGAGKTVATARGSLFSKCVFETNISDHEVGQRRVQEILDAGWQPTILAVFADPLTCLDRVVRRASNEGRVVRCEAIARIHACLPDTLIMLNRKFGANLEIGIIDNSRDFSMPQYFDGLAPLNSLRCKEDSGKLRKMLIRTLDQKYAPTISEQIYAEIRGE